MNNEIQDGFKAFVSDNHPTDLKDGRLWRLNISHLCWRSLIPALGRPICGIMNKIKKILMAK
jgi:hypothetical protein